MNTTTVENWTVAELRPFLEAAGFTWYAPLHQFRRTTDTGFICVILAVSDFVDRHLVEAHLGVRIDSVENLVFPHLNGPAGFRDDSMTLVTPLGRLSGRPYERFPVRDRTETRAAATSIEAQLLAAGLPFLERYRDIAELEGLYNADPKTPITLLHNPIHRCFRGLALAQRTGRRDLPALYATYRDEIKHRYDADWALVGFTALGQALLGYSLN